MIYICYDGTHQITYEQVPDIVDEWNDIVITPENIFNPDGTVSKSSRDVRKEKLEEFLLLFTRVNFDRSISGPNLVVSGTTVLPAGRYLYNNITILNGGTLLCEGDEASNSGVIIVARNIDVQSGGLLSADDQGFQWVNSAYPTYAPGPGGGQQGGGARQGGAGGGYGGAGGGGGYCTFGGCAPQALGGSNYGSVLNPTQLGSSGGRGDSSNTPPLGSGGGAIRLVVGETLTINGKISANGHQGRDTGNDGGGGGSGGSIWITSKIIYGSGDIESKGGRGGSTNNTSGGGGGSGGRIRLYSASSTFSGNISVDGGIGGPKYFPPGAGGSAGYPGEDGTLSIN
jgi:hypothetical protein